MTCMPTRLLISPRALVALSALLLVALGAPARAVTIEWVPVGNAGNANDPFTGSQFGGVAYNYSIAKYDVTNRQYAEYLNTKDPTGSNALGLWNSNFGNAFYGGISFNGGNANGSKYVLTVGRENHPLNYVTWYEAIRFANWLNNGQGSGDTESGAYTLLGGTPTPSNALSITRNAGATVVLPSESEWYKAAYYDPGSNSYFQYATSSNSIPIASAPTALANHANYSGVVRDLTDVGAYSGTTSPYGAFDMNGNVDQWNEALISSTSRGIRGGSFGFTLDPISLGRGNDQPSWNYVTIGFRVAMVPEPSTAALAVVACGLMWVLRRRFK
jgi:formylglycine-generating enzyme required for sulfatase activity